MPDLIRHPVPYWIPACAGMTSLRYLIAGVIIYEHSPQAVYTLCFEHSNLVHLILPFDLAQGGELVEPFGISNLMLWIFIVTAADIIKRNDFSLQDRLLKGTP